MDRLVLDPYHHDLARWRIMQDTVVAIYVNHWYTSKNKEKMAYQFSTSGDGPTKRMYLIDKDNRIAVEFEMVNERISVKWIRSIADYRKLDAIGQRMSRTKEKTHA